MPREFDPPYDSPIEEDLAWGLSKYLAPTTRLHKQVEVPTTAATFYLDLVAQTASGHRVAFECDGKEYHKDALKDECRDALILGTGAVSAIYRFRGSDVYYRQADCLFYILSHDPCLFSYRGRRNIELLASDEARSAVGRSIFDLGERLGHGYEMGGSQWLFYRDKEREFMSVLQRRSLQGMQSAMAAFVAFAGKHPGESFLRLVERFGKGER